MAENNQPDGIMSSVAVANLPWAFTQNHPLTTREFIEEAKKRGFDLDLSVLRELYRHQLLVPFVYVTTRQVGDIPEPPVYEPMSHGTTLFELRHARDRDRLADLAAQPFKPRLRFERKAPDRRDWWNGLIYSRYQLLGLHEARHVLSKRSLRRRHERWISKLPAPHGSVVQSAARLRRIALAATALEARYLPKFDPERLRLVNTDEDKWQAYRCTGPGRQTRRRRAARSSRSATGSCRSWTRTPETARRLRLGTLIRLRRIRVGTQHADARHKAVDAFREVGLPFPPRSWDHAWTHVAAIARGALDALREEVKAGLRQASSPVPPPAG
jgi:hypothetical protein